MGGTGYATVINNVVRGKPADASRQNAAVIVQVPAARVAGNIIVDYTSITAKPIEASSVAVVIANNLCFNNSGLCPEGSGNLNADPKFVDLEDYRLAPGSPAIDAGPSDYGLADLDRTRNDMGPHGGPWSIAQYDAQRAEGTYAPFVYPLFKADSGFSGGSLEIRALGVARLR